MDEANAMRGWMPGVWAGGRLACLAGVLVLALAGALCPAQVTPLRTYYGVDRPVVVRVEQPVDEASAGGVSLTLELRDHGAMFEVTTEPEGAGRQHSPIADRVVRASVEAGEVDLANVFPTLWTDPHTPGARYRTVQLLAGDQRVGPAVVLQPLTRPARATLVHAATREAYFVDPSTQQENFAPKEGSLVWFSPAGVAGRVVSGIRAYVDKHVVLETSVGAIEIRLLPQAAPNTAWNFRTLVEGGFYHDIAFHRIVPKTPKGDAFVVQVGDPTGTGDGGPGYDVALEPSPLAHDFGVVSMARDADPDTNGSQFFICLSREGTKGLDGKYTAFGEVVRGLPALLALEQTKVRGDRPIEPPILKEARLVDAAPLSGPGAARRIERPAGAGRERDTSTPER